MHTKITIELLKERLESQKDWLKAQNKWLIDSKNRYEKNQKDWDNTLKYIEDLKNDIKVIEEEEAK